MAQTMPYPRYSKQTTAEDQEPPLSAKTASRRKVKVGPLLLIACLALAICVVLLVPLMVSGTSSVSTGRSTASAQSQAVAYTTYNTAEEAAIVAGLQSALPHGLPEGAGVSVCRVVDGTVLELEVVYGKTTFLYRAAAGNEDLSATDYDTIPYTATEEAGDVSIGYAGHSEKKLTSAVWIEGNHSYALVCENGVEQTVMKEMAEALA